MTRYRVLGIVIAAFIGWYVFTAPDSAAAAVRGVLSGLEAVGNSAVQFGEALAGGAP
jgi:hypothetical protein